MDGQDFRSLTVVDALHALLEQLERRYDDEPDQELEPRIETGVPAIDRLLGGIATGAVTAITVDHPVHAAALGAAVARRSPHDVMLATPDVLVATRTIVSAASAVPYAFLDSGVLTRDEWTKIGEACYELRDRPIHLTACTSSTAIIQAAKAVSAPLCVVLAPERLADDVEVALHRLDADVRDEPVAVLALTTESVENADATAMSNSPIAATLSLIAPDPVDLLRRTSLSINQLCRRAG